MTDEQISQAFMDDIHRKVAGLERDLLALRALPEEDGRRIGHLLWGFVDRWLSNLDRMCDSPEFTEQLRGVIDEAIVRVQHLRDQVLQNGDE